MWILHPVGFFSVVAKPGDTQLTVRARVAKDLDRLRERALPELGPTRAGEGSDYPYRASVDAAHFGAGLARLGASVDYPNFKTEVARRQGRERAHAYGKVWSALYGLEARLPRGEAESDRSPRRAQHDSHDPPRKGSHEGDD